MSTPPDAADRYMQTYLNELNRRSAESAAEGEERRRLRKELETKKLQLELARLSASPKAVKSLDDQIVELMRTLPPQLRDRPWSMAELVQRLTGKYRDRPHAQNVGEALRRLGWRRERRYADGYDGRRVWFPPGCPGY
jgi:hypothetical protein